MGDNLRVKLAEQLLARPDPKAWLEVLRDHLSQQTLSFGHGTSSAADEAYWLVQHFCPQPECQDAETAARIAQVVERRIKERLPLAYLLKEAWFAGLKFYVDQRVLIPRSPLAEVIERGFAPWHSGTGRLLDLGTGSGCLAIASAYYGDFQRVDALDLSSEALAVAAINVSLLQTGAQVRLLQSDLYSALDDQIYDVIVANPPYVPTTRLRELPPEYGYEPGLALAAGAEGLDVMEAIFSGAAKHLSADGFLFLEVGETAEALAGTYPDVPFIWLELERGGDGVLALAGAQVRQYWV